MSDFWIALLLKPFFALIIFGGIVAPVKYLVFKTMKDGPTKRLLFRRFGD